MLPLFDFLSSLRRRDVRLWTEQGRLRYSAPKGSLEPALLQELKARRDEILAFLSRVDGGARDAGPSVTPVSRGPRPPLSHAQQRLWYVYQLDRSSPVYNLPIALRLTGEVDHGALTSAIHEIVRRHEVLRTTFANDDQGVPYQIIAPTLELRIPIVPVGEASHRASAGLTPLAAALKHAVAAFRRPFDLETGPLLRVELLRLEPWDHLLLLTLHHVIADGWSLGVLSAELTALYDAFSRGRPSPLPPLPIQYADFAHWQRAWLEDGVLEAQLRWWKAHLGEEVPVLALPTDRPRPAVPGVDGATQTARLSRDLTAALKTLGEREGSTLFITLLAGFNALLARYAGQDTVVVGSPVANRSKRELEPLIGFFANVLVLKSDLSGDPTFRELLARVREVALGAFSHQDLPFERLVEALQPDRSAVSQPLFQVMFVLQNAPLPALRLPDLTVEGMAIDSGTAHFDLLLNAWEQDGMLVLNLEHRTDLWDPATVVRMLEHFATLLESAVADPGARLSELRLMSPAERTRVAGFSRVFAQSGAAFNGEASTGQSLPPEEQNGGISSTYGVADRWTPPWCGTPSPLWILDAAHQLTPIGIPGRIAIPADVDDPAAIRGPEGPVRFTGDRGRWRADGRLELTGATDGRFWRDGRRIDLLEVQASLNALPEVDDSVARVRETTDGRRELVAYVVGSSPWTSDWLRQQLEASVPAALVPDTFVSISSIPLTDRGAIDDAALFRMPVIDGGLLEALEARMRADLALDEVSVVERAPAFGLGRVHLDDLLPSGVPWEGRAGSRRAAPLEALEPEAQPKHPPARPPALADGGPLHIPDDAPQTLTEALLRTAEVCADKGIHYVSRDGARAFQSYAALLDRARRILAGLQAQGLEPGSRMMLQIDALEDHFAAFWACVLGGITPVTVAIAPTYREPNAVVMKLFNTWKLLEHPPVLTSDALLPALAGLEALMGMDGMRLLSVDALKTCRPAGEIHPARPADLVFFQLTSGSTGVPKCIQETHQAIIAHIHGSQQFNGYTPDDVVLNWLPVDHVVPILTIHLRDVYLGCTEVQVRSERVLVEPLAWLDLIDDFRVTHTWAPNFGFKLVADRLVNGDTTRGWDLSCVRAFMNAGEQVTLPVVRDFLAAVAPFGVRSQAMQPAFGMAEVCTCMTYTNDFTLETGVHRFLKSSLGGALIEAEGDDRTTIPFIDLGPPVPGIEIRITDADNRVLPEGTIGRFQIRGASVTPGYLYNEAANLEAFVGDGWFNSGDLGFILEGRLSLTGREKEMIIVRGANFYCYEIEDVVNRIEGVEPTFSAACAVEDPGTGTEGLAVFYVPKPDAPDPATLASRVRQQVTSSMGLSPLYVVPLEKAEFPKTTSGKIQRTQLKKALAAGQFASRLKALDLLEGSASTLPDWFYRPTWRRRDAAPVAGPSPDRDGALSPDPTSQGIGDLSPDPTFQGVGDLSPDPTFQGVGDLSPDPSPVRGGASQSSSYTSGGVRPGRWGVFADVEGWPGRVLVSVHGTGYLRGEAAERSGEAAERSVLHSPLLSEVAENGPGLKHPTHGHTVGGIRERFDGSGNDGQDAPPLTGEGSGERSRGETGERSRGETGERSRGETGERSRGETGERSGEETGEGPVFERCREILAAADHPVTDILYLSTLGDDADAEAGVADLLLLIHALARHAGERAVRLLVASSRSQQVTPDEPVDPIRAALPVLLRTAAQELPWLEVRHVDLPADAPQTWRDCLELERLDRSGELEVAWRNGQRFVRRLEPAALDRSAAQPLPFKPGGFYVLSGGLGGLGVEVARLLLERFGARLLVVGRTPIESADRGASAHDVTPPVAELRAAEGFQLAEKKNDHLEERMRALSRLRALGDVLYVAADIADRAQLEAAVATARARWSLEPDGVLHLAGEYHERMLTDEAPAALVASLRAGLEGARNLAALLEGRPHPLFVAFSSVNAFFGGFQVGAYAAANRALEALCLELERSGRPDGVRAWCLSWSQWDGLGMRRGSRTRQAAEARGYLSIGLEPGLNAMLAALARAPGLTLIGLDRSRPNIARFLPEHPAPTGVVAFVAGGAPGATLSGRATRLRDAGLEASDRFGMAIRCAIEQLPALPRKGDGRVDRAALSARNRSRGTTDRARPRTPLEQRIARVWQEVLGVADISIDDNFFALGGSSLAAVRAVALLEKELERPLPLSALVNGATVGALARQLADEDGPMAVSCLMPLQPLGDGPPLFLVHPAGGTVLLYLELARRLGEDRPVYGLQAPGLDGVVEPLETVETMAARYLAEARRVQPQGPYYLGGQSLGGLVAFEMARRLSAEGLEVGLLAVLDAPAPSPGGGTEASGNAPGAPEIPTGASGTATRASRTVTGGMPALSDAGWLVQILRVAERFFDRDLGVVPAELEALDAEGQIDHVLERLRSTGLLPPGAGRSQVRGLLRVYKASAAAFNAYRPADGYGGRLTLFRATDPLDWEDDLEVLLRSPDDTLGWRRLCASVEVRTVPGNHLTMTAPPHVETLALQLDAALAATRRRTSTERSG